MVMYLLKRKHIICCSGSRNPEKISIFHLRPTKINSHTARRVELVEENHSITSTHRHHLKLKVSVESPVKEHSQASVSTETVKSKDKDYHPHHCGDRTESARGHVVLPSPAAMAS